MSFQSKKAFNQLHITNNMEHFSFKSGHVVATRCEAYNNLNEYRLTDLTCIMQRAWFLDGTWKIMQL